MTLKSRSISHSTTFAVDDKYDVSDIITFEMLDIKLVKFTEYDTDNGVIRWKLLKAKNVIITLKKIKVTEYNSRNGAIRWQMPNL